MFPSYGPPEFGAIFLFMNVKYCILHKCQLEVSVWELWSKELEENLAVKSCEVWRNKVTVSFPLHTITWWAAVGHTVSAVDVSDVAHWLASGHFCSYHKKLPSGGGLWICLHAYWSLIRCVHKIVKSNCLLHHVCSSVRPYGTTRIPLDGFSWNLTFQYSRVQVSLISDKKNQYFTCTWTQVYICTSPV
jgi:hypothetical protein